MTQNSDHGLPRPSPRIGSGRPAVRAEGTIARPWVGETISLHAYDHPGPGDDQEFDVTTYLRMLLRRKWSILGVLLTALACGLAFLFLATPEYRAVTTLQIEREAAKVVDVEGAEPSQSGSGDREFYNTHYELLRSRSLAERVVRSLNLRQDPAFRRMVEDPSWTEVVRSRVLGDEAPAEIVLSERAAAAALLARLKVEPIRNSRLVRVSFESPDRRLSARVVNAVAQTFIGSTLARRFDASSYARDFLQSRLQQVKQQLEDSERRLVAYAQRQQIVNVASGEEGGPGKSITESSLVSLNDALSVARADRIRAEGQWRQASSSDGLALPAVLQSGSVSSLRDTRAKLSAEYQQKLSTFQPNYPDMVQLRAQIAELDRQVEAEVSTIRRSVRNQYEIARRQEAALAQQVSTLKSGVLDLQGRSIQHTILQREVDTNRTLYDGLLKRYAEIGIAGGLGTNHISVVDRAEVPGSPSKPNRLRVLAIAGLIGLLGGILLAFLLENLDETLKTAEDVEQKIGLALLGTIPTLRRGQSMLDALGDQRSHFAEAYYSARTALEFSTEQGVPRVLLLTSSRPAEGKSTSAHALGLGFAQLGMRVLLIDADLRNPSLHRSLQTDNTAGITNVLTGAAQLEDVVREVRPGLFFMPCGPLPPNPAELLAGMGLRALLDAAREHYDVVMVDGPPVMGLADAALLASVADGTLLMVESGVTRVSLARAALKRLQMGRGRVIGALLTKVKAPETSYDYGYGYAPPPRKPLFGSSARPKLGRA